MAAGAIFEAFPDARLRNDFEFRVFSGTTDLDSGVRSAAVGMTGVLFRRSPPDEHLSTFATIVAKLPPVVVDNSEVEVEIEGEDEDGDAEGGVMLASEEAFGKLSRGRPANERR